jgi:hypothetical protein
LEGSGFRLPSFRSSLHHGVRLKPGISLRTPPPILSASRPIFGASDFNQPSQNSTLETRHPGEECADVYSLTSIQASWLAAFHGYLFVKTAIPHSHQRMPQSCGLQHLKISSPLNPLVLLWAMVLLEIPVYSFLAPQPTAFLNLFRRTLVTMLLLLCKFHIQNLASESWRPGQNRGRYLYVLQSRLMIRNRISGEPYTIGHIQHKKSPSVTGR